MGVDITIVGNQEFCQSHNLVIKDEFECQCVFHEIPNCDCGGTGKVILDRYPWSMHLCYSNWQEILETLGLDLDSISGSIQGSELLDRMSEWGRDVRVRYRDTLFQIAAEAARRGVHVEWA